MRGQIAISDTKPRGHSIRLDLFETSECLIAQAPAADGVQLSGKAVHDGIDVRTDVKSPHLRIVANIHDHVNVFFGNYLNEAAKEFGSAGSAGKHSVVSRSHTAIWNCRH